MSLARSWARRGAPAIGLVGFFGLWELFVRVRHVPEYKLIKPSAALREIVRHPGGYWADARPTMAAAAAGFLAAAILAFAIGSLLAQFVALERAVLPIALLVVVTPLSAYITTVVIWVGFGFRALVVAVAVVCFPPMLFATVSAMRAVEPASLELLASVGASRWEIFRKLQAPGAALPFLSAAKVSAGLSLVGVTIGEPYALVDNGLGRTIRVAASSGTVALPLLWGSIFVLGFIGSFAYMAISGIESAVRRWQNPSGLGRNPS